MEEEKQRREDNDLKKMNKDEKARLAQRLADRIQKQQEKERLLQYT